ncbi:MAG: TIGR04086 family membrane protein [Ruminococcus sp.]|nr:TIGR04086 family membrane protein [Ruminococcus sp.]
MSDKRLLIKASIFGTICGILVSVILMCICAVVIVSAGLLPYDILNYIMLAVLGTGALFGGFITARITKSAGLIVGALTAIIIFILVTIIGMLKGTDSFSILTLFRLVTTIVLGSLGGVLGVNKREKLHIK